MTTAWNSVLISDTRFALISKFIIILPLKHRSFESNAPLDPPYDRQHFADRPGITSLTILLNAEFIVQRGSKHKKSILAVIVCKGDGTCEAEYARRNTITSSKLIRFLFDFNVDTLIRRN
jgi:hypothetical protein